MSSEGNFQAEMTGRIGELRAIFQQIEGRAFDEIGSARLEYLYIQILACQVRLEHAAERFPSSVEQYARRARLAGEHAELIHAHYLYQRKRELFSSTASNCKT